jgi:hypothetical protein
MTPTIAPFASAIPPVRCGGWRRRGFRYSYERKVFAKTFNQLWLDCRIGTIVHNNYFKIIGCNISLITRRR